MGLAGPQATPYASITAILSWLIALTTALRGWSIPSRRPPILLLLLYSMVILSITLIMTPNLAQSFYRGQVMRSVVPPLIIATLFLGLIQWSGANPSLFSCIKFALAGVASFVAGGFSETYACIQTIALVTMFVIVISWRTPIEKASDLDF